MVTRIVVQGWKIQVTLQNKSLSSAFKLASAASSFVFIKSSTLEQGGL